MYPEYFVNIALYLLPFLMLALTWTQPHRVAMQRMVRVQVIGSVVYLFAFPLVCQLRWPNNAFHPTDLLASLTFWSGDGVLMAYPLVLGAILTAAAWGIRTHAQRKQTIE